MKILIKSCTIVSTEKRFNGPQDILIEDGLIADINPSIDTDADQIITFPNLHCSVGWYDARVNFNDPGHEYKEDLESGIQAALYGGMTAVSVVPGTEPAISNKSQIEYLIKQANGSGIDLYPYGTLTKENQGENLSEMYDMQQAGAVGFTDQDNEVSSGIMYRALLYAKNFGGKVISFPTNRKIFGKGFVNEGTASVMTGLKSIPSIAEYITVQRDLSLLEYTDSTIHFTGISTKESVELIRATKQKGLKVTADAYVANLVYTEDEVLGFDANFKLNPPLRTDQDRMALLNGVKDGTIDFVCSNHSPQDKESKDVEFDQAEFGVIGTQFLFQEVNKLSLSLDEKIALIAEKPRKIFNKPISIEKGAQACLTFFDPNGNWQLEKAHIASKSHNTPLLDTTLKGKVYGIINKKISTLPTN